MSSRFNPALPPAGTEPPAFFRALREAFGELVHFLKGLKRDGNAFEFDGTLSAPQYTSTIATGDGAPFVVASTDKVVGLNADLLDDQSGAHYLSRTNHTGTQTASTISDFASAARALLSVLDGANIDLSYNSTTGEITASITGTVPVGNGGTGLNALGAANAILAVNGAGTANAYGLLVDANVSGSAAIGWSKVSKTGSSLADLATRSAGSLSSGNLPYAQLSTGTGTWDIGGGATLSFLRTFQAGALSVTGSAIAGATAASQNAAAVLQADSTTKGFLPPRMTTTQRDNVSSPPEGLVVYNTTTHKLNVRGAAAWEAVTSA